MVSRKKRMKASDTRLFKELYSVHTKEKHLIQLFSSFTSVCIIESENRHVTEYGMLTFFKR